MTSDSGRAWLITGGSGIGHARHALRGGGCNLHLVSRDQGGSTPRAPRSREVRQDVARGGSARRAVVKRIMRRLRRGGYLVASGRHPGGSVLDIDEAGRRHAWDLKLSATST
jgi:hypothetical protein